MKNYVCLFAFLCIASLTGCATQKQVAQMEGQGRKVIYEAPYDAVWRAAVDAAQSGELNVIRADKSRGYIAANRGMQVETMGENVGVWVRPTSPNETSVEVVSCQAGLPLAWFKNWEKQIQNGVCANLTRESTADARIIEEPAGGEYPGRTYHVP